MENTGFLQERPWLKEFKHMTHFKFASNFNRTTRVYLSTYRSVWAQDSAELQLHILMVDKYLKLWFVFFYFHNLETFLSPTNKKKWNLDMNYLYNNQLDANEIPVLLSLITLSGTHILTGSPLMCLLHSPISELEFTPPPLQFVKTLSGYWVCQVLSQLRIFSRLFLRNCDSRSSISTM